MHILGEEPAVFSEEKQLILQPQSKAAELRRWLSGMGFFIRQEKLSRDGKFLYSAMEAVWTGECSAISLSQALLPDSLLKSGDPLLGSYYRRICAGVQMTVRGLHQAKECNEELLSEYEKTLRELKEMGDRYGIGE